MERDDNERPVIVSAQPGFELADYWGDDLVWLPVIAWKVEQVFIEDRKFGDGEWMEHLYPIIPGPKTTMAENHPIIRSPGKLIMAIYESDGAGESDVLAYFRKLDKR